MLADRLCRFVRGAHAAQRLQSADLPPDKSYVFG
jgi:hypothetical protein